MRRAPSRAVPFVPLTLVRGGMGPPASSPSLRSASRAWLGVAGRQSADSWHLPPSPVWPRVGAGGHGAPRPRRTAQHRAGRLAAYDGSPRTQPPAAPAPGPQAAWASFPSPQISGKASSENQTKTHKDYSWKKPQRVTQFGAFESQVRARPRKVQDAAQATPLAGARAVSVLHSEGSSPPEVT